MGESDLDRALVERVQNGERAAFDLLVRNESPDPLWSKESAYILFECKKWG